MARKETTAPTMKLWYWQFLFILLCVWDTIATYCILGLRIATEGNPLMNTVIQDSGWGMVWLIKIGLGAVFVYAMPSLVKQWWGKSLVGLAFGAYLWTAGVHVFLLYVLP